MSRLRGAPMVLTLVLAIAVTGCARRTDASAELNGILGSSLRHSFHFVYTEKTKSTTTRVEGAIEDDFRYQDALTVNGNPVASEVVRDDARALRFVDYATAVKLFTSKASANPPGGVTGPNGEAQAIAPTTALLLQGGGWVVDKSGAAPLSEVVNIRRHLGDDPVYDALTIPSYIDGAVNATISASSDRVVKFNPEDINYNPSLDPFPHPDAGKGEVRYDILPPTLPPRGQQGEQSQIQLRQNLPGIAYFRNLSVYVRNGRLDHVLESISVKRRLQEPNNDLVSRFKDAGAEVPAGGSLEDQSAAILKALDSFFGKDPQVQPVRERDMSFYVSDVGTAVDVEVPDGGQVGNLGGALVRGQVLRQRSI